MGMVRDERMESVGVLQLNGCDKNSEKQLRESLLLNPLMLFDERSGVCAWGIANPAREKQFIEYYWLTLASNCKTIICISNAFFGCINLYSILRSLVLKSSSSLFVAVMMPRTILTCTFALWFCKRAVPGWQRKCWSGLMRVGVHIGPPMLISDHCSQGTALGVIGPRTIAYALVIPFFQPVWPISTLYMLVVCWVPLLYSFFLIPERNGEFMLSWTALCLCISVAGPLWGAWVAISHRIRWMTRPPSSTKVNWNRSEQDAKERRRSSLGKRKSTSSRRSRSASMLWEVSEERIAHGRELGDVEDFDPGLEGEGDK